MVELKAIHVRIDAELYRKVKLHCIMTDRSIREFISEALAEKLDREEGKGEGNGESP